MQAPARETWIDHRRGRSLLDSARRADRRDGRPPETVATDRDNASPYFSAVISLHAACADGSLVRTSSGAGSAVTCDHRPRPWSGEACLRSASPSLMGSATGGRYRPCVTEPVFYARPAVAASTLTVAPALASWDRAASPGQVRSAAFIDEVCTVVAEPLGSIAGPLALRLDIGLPKGVPLYVAHDLDNYLFPLVPRLTARTGRPIASVWATKRHAATSLVRIAPAIPVDGPRWEYAFEVITTASASTVGYKEQVRDQITSTRPLSGAGVALQLAFVVGPQRVWPNLWKATIDALGAILGRDKDAHEWNARDGRITDLGLHCTIDPTMGNKVTIAIRASTTTS